MRGRELSAEEAFAYAMLKKEDMPYAVEIEATDKDNIANMATADLLEYNFTKHNYDHLRPSRNSKDYMDAGQIVCATSNCCKRSFLGLNISCCHIVM